MPSLRERWQGFRHGRAATDAIPFHPEFPLPSFGGGIGGKPSHATLLRESRGVADNATRAIANRVSTLNPQVKISRRNGAGTLQDEVLDDHVLKALLDRPHPNLSRAQLLRLTAQHIVTVGEAYWLKVGSQLGVPVELHPMPPGLVAPIMRQGVVQEYAVQDGKGSVRRIPTNTVMRFYFPDPENVWSAEGYLEPGGMTADSLKFAGQTMRSHYQNDATPKVALEANKDAVAFTPEQEKRFTEKWKQDQHRRLSNSSAPAITPTGYKLVQLAMQTGKEIVPLLEHWRDEQLMGFFTPRSVLGQVVSGDRSSAEVNQWVFDRYGVSPIATLISDGVTHQLAPDFDPSIFVEFEPFVSEDKAFVLEQETADTQNKVRSPQQILRDRGGDPEDASWGEFPVGTLAEAPYTGDVEPIGPNFAGAITNPVVPPNTTEEGEPENEDERARHRLSVWFAPVQEWRRQIRREKKFVPAFLRQMRSIFRDQETSVLSRLEDDGDRSRHNRVTAEELFAPGEWTALFKRRVDPVRDLAFREILAETLVGLGQSETFVFTDAMRQFLKNEGAALVKETGATTQLRITEALQVSVAQGEGVSGQAALIKRVFAERRKNGARTIARTETLKASQRAQIDGFKTSKVVEKKQWNTSLDDVVRNSHAATNEQIVDLDDFFVLGDLEDADAPGIGGGGGSLSAGNTINCRCFVTPVLED